MKVMLIDPPGIEGIAVGRILGSFGTNKVDQAWPPYDLQVMAGYLRTHGHDFRILDANNLDISLNEVGDEIKSYGPDWVVYLTCFQTFDLDAGVAMVARGVNPAIRTACMSLSMFSVIDPEKKMKAFPFLDYIAWGEPEDPLMRLINGEPPDKVEGIYYHGPSGEVKFTGEAKRITHLDELGVPVHEGLPLKLYRCPLARSAPMSIVNCSRGCINKCVHCQAGSFQKPLRYRSVESVMKELRDLKRLGVREIKFYDCSLPTNRSFTEALTSAMIKERFNFAWQCNARADRLDERLLTAMKKSGCHTVSIGCESASPAILKNMNKNETVEQIEEAVRLVKKLRMRVLMYLTFGLEGETEATMHETFDFVKRLRPDYVTYGIVVPAPGTPFYHALHEKGYLKHKELHKQDPTALPSFSYPELPAERILSFTRDAYRQYYLSAGYILRRLASLRTYTEFKASVTNAAALVSRYVIGKAR